MSNSNKTPLASQDSAMKIGASLLKLMQNGNFGLPEASDFTSTRVAVFIHGFTADATYMKPLMEEFLKYGYSTFAFNYPCFDGIDYAAQSLANLLSQFDEMTSAQLSKNGVVIVAHSMGGLVARALVGPEKGDKYVRKVFTLGSPHDGTMLDNRILEWYVTWGETFGGLVRGGYKKSKKSALQLMKADGPHPYLDALLEAPTNCNVVEFHSFSGGKNHLTLGKGKGLRERALNILIQRHLKNPNNDGLVLETSSDLSAALFSDCAAGCTHHNSYADYKILNHSHLCQNQYINSKIVQLSLPVLPAVHIPTCADSADSI